MQLHRSTLHQAPAGGSQGRRCHALRSPSGPGGSGSRAVQAAARRTRTSTSLATDVDSESKVGMSRESKLEMLMSNMNQRFGRGSIMKLGSAVPATATTPSGSLSVDVALGGGWPKGRIVEIYGPESSGKTTLALHAIAEVQKKGGVACFIDAEHAFDAKYAKSLGVDIDNLMMAQPDSGEQALEMADELARSTVCDLVVIDSVSALVPKAELEGEIGNMQVGLQARLMSQGLRKLAGQGKRGNTTIMFLNQLRYKIGVMYGNPETTSGGNALKFYASVRVDVRKKETISAGTDAEGATGIRVRAKIVKNKVAPPFKEAEFVINFGSGIDFLGGLADAAEACGVLTRRGAYYYMGDAKLGQGKERVLEALRTNEELRQQMIDQTRSSMTQHLAEVVGDVEDAAALPAVDDA